jgi:2,4-dienoyl-CoA reductase-like NADH-dependent reductase (Old Yellow Enzyme family)
MAHRERGQKVIMSALFSPFTLRGVTLPNRIVVSPMCQLTLQLAHAGRKGSSRLPWEGGHQIRLAEGGWLADAPSALEHRQGEVKPLALDLAELSRIRTAFAEAAIRAARLGFDGIEIHGAHGYLLHEFLSPVSNHRTDGYGGSLANRLRFPLEIFETVRAAFPADRPVGVKVSATDWMEGGWDLAQSVEYAKELRKLGADWVTASSGGISPLQKITVGPGYQVPFAEAVKQGAKVTAMAVGLITAAQQAEHIIETGKADLVALARAMLYDPRWPWHAAAELGATVEASPPYWRSQPQGQNGLFGSNAQVGMR